MANINIYTKSTRSYAITKCLQCLRICLPPASEAWFLGQMVSNLSEAFEIRYRTSLSQSGASAKGAGAWKLLVGDLRTT